MRVGQARVPLGAPYRRVLVHVELEDMLHQSFQVPRLVGPQDEVGVRGQVADPIDRHMIAGFEAGNIPGNADTGFENIPPLQDAREGGGKSRESRDMK